MTNMATMVEFDTEWVRGILAERFVGGGEAFDRWLAKHDAEVAAKAYAQGVGRTLEVLGTATTPGDGLLTVIGNPYREVVQS